VASLPRPIKAARCVTVHPAPSLTSNGTQLRMQVESGTWVPSVIAVELASLRLRRKQALLERSHIRNQTPQKILCIAYQTPLQSIPAAPWVHELMCPTCQRLVSHSDRAVGKKPGAGGGPGVPVRPGPVVSVSYSAGHVPDWRGNGGYVCALGEIISPCWALGEIRTGGYPYFGGFLACAVPCGRCWLGDGAG